MPLPSESTQVSYPGGATASTGTVLHVAPYPDGRFAVLLDATACHPVDTAWPDQPSDRGVLRCADGRELALEAVTGAISAEGELFLGDAVPVRTGSEGWLFVVAHLVAGEPPSPGERVEVELDRELRLALSTGHTACHLASLALDAALAGAWRKEVPADALGAPGFDALACASSRIEPNGSLDRYRIGKSLRRKGFEPAALEDLAAVQAAANARLAEWLAAGGAVRVDVDGPALTDRRSWHCELAEATVRIPCGGTHISELAELASVTVELALTEVEGGLELEMRTRAERAAAAARLA